ncbi:hypothetical protein FPFC_012520 [Fructobacillus pseudoficulneus]|uniref:Plasmid maintenance system killer protein n=1 Tax=Fructobacillus pseudoficulneus TaxID=220714 RepID=A0A3F3GVN0_9LACO|nr:type II toxin-antitoxin system RelE/ParE family toxin [Fructobacillus pseudoficulneus]GAP02372.1 hypothetical protein FPFC_012520 [Fructobacillus pseudoficulneus]SEH36531.1 proteic killer suppression protein [Fructobacillus pseudoficulneus]
MEIVYLNKKIEQQCTKLTIAKKDFPEKVARKLHSVINLLETVENLGDIIRYPPLHFHSLRGTLKEYYAMDIDGRHSSYRLIVKFDEQSQSDIVSEAAAIHVISLKEVSNHYE